MGNKHNKQGRGKLSKRQLPPFSYGNYTTVQEITVIDRFEVLGESKSSADYGDNPKVNLSTGRLLYTMPDLSIGAGNYAISIAHVYHSMDQGAFEDIFPGMGTGWKLNVQQYVKKKSDGAYAYLDGNGYVHNFVLFDETQKRYNDEDGLGLVLTEEEYGSTIKDEAGNELEFGVNGRLIASVSGLNSSIRKLYNYNAAGQLTRVYDTRTLESGTPREYIKFNYNTAGNLSSMQAYESGVCKQTKYFDYTGELLKGELVSNTDGGSKREILFEYYDDNTIKNIIEWSTKTQLKVIYDNEKLVKKLETGYTPINDYTFGAQYVEKSSLEFKYNFIDETDVVLSVDITNKKGVTTRHYLNRQNEIVSVFETDGNNLKTLNRESKKVISVGGSMSTKINLYTCREVSSDTFTASVTSNFKLYRSNAEKKNKYFSCSFWLMHSEIAKRMKVKATYSFNLNGTNQGTNTAEVFIDGYAYKAWQKVTIPLIAPEVSEDDDINTLSSLSITLQNLDGTEVSGFSLSKFSFSAAPYTEMLLMGTSKLKFNKCDKVKIICFNKSYEFNNMTSSEIYFTEQDLIRTETNKYANPITSENGYTYYDAICNNGTKRISGVMSVYLYEGSNSLQMQNTNTPFCSYMIASDNKSTTEQFYKFSDDTFSLETKVTLYPDGLSGEAESYSNVSTKVNYKGKKLSETDEYDMVTRYSYDSYGNLTTKTVSGSDGKQMVFTNEYDDNGEYLKNSNDGITTTEFGYIKPLNLLETESSNGLCSQTSYDNYYDKVENVTLFETANNANKFKNEITYKNGVIRTVSDGNSKYGVQYNPVADKTTYTQFDSCDSTVESTIQTEQLIRNSDGSETTEITYCRGSDTDKLTSTVDKYGKVINAFENGVEKVSYAYLNNDDESESTNLVDSVIDGYENRKTTYEYDPDGNLMKWTKSTLSDENELSVHQIFAGDTKYTIGEKEKYFTHIVKDTAKNISPQIISTGASYDPDGDTDDDQKEIKNYRRNYTYDSLGRLTMKSSTAETNKTQTHGISYKVVNGNETNLPERTTYSLNKNTTIVHLTGITEIGYNVSLKNEYNYDEKGNLLKVIENGNSYKTETDYYAYVAGGTTTYQICEFSTENNYTYDEFNRIKTESNTAMEIDRSYDYYPNGKLKAITGTNAKTFEYDAKGRLTKCGAASFIYDNYGNRTSKTENGTTVNYKFTRGNLLTESGSAKYSYNADGVRYQKEVNGVTTKYYLDGGKIIGEDRGSEKIRYFYDIDGLCGIRYKNVNYDVVRNAFGDIVMLMNDNNIVARYEYDMWGNCKVYTYQGDDIGNVNPFRWKGHYYDAETGCYYANGRYYDPETGTYLDASDAASVVDNAYTPLGLDRNGILCNNVHEFVRNLYAIFTVLEMSPDGDYDPNENKPWWEIAWNAITQWFAERFSELMEWYNGISWTSKVIIGTVLFVAAVALTIITHGALLPLFTGMAISIGMSMLSGGLSSFKNGGSFLEGAIDGFAEGVFWGGVFAAVSASVHAIKYGVGVLKSRLPIKMSVNGFPVDEQIYTYARNIKPIKGYTDVALHGTSKTVVLNGKHIDAKTFASFLKNHPGYLGGNIRLISCNTGAISNGFAQQLSRELGVNVLAPSKVVYIWSNGSLTIGQGIKSGLNIGKWILFKP